MRGRTTPQMMKGFAVPFTLASATLLDRGQFPDVKVGFPEGTREAKRKARCSTSPIFRVKPGERFGKFSPGCPRQSASDRKSRNFFY